MPSHGIAEQLLVLLWLFNISCLQVPAAKHAEPRRLDTSDPFFVSRRVDNIQSNLAKDDQSLHAASGTAPAFSVWAMPSVIGSYLKLGALGPE
jgi:hypothetical protein